MTVEAKIRTGMNPKLELAKKLAGVEMMAIGSQSGQRHCHGTGTDRYQRRD